MEIFFRDYLERLTKYHNEMEKILDGLPSEALDWTPGGDTNSLSVMIFHLTGAERYWIGDVLMGEPAERDRAAEFRVRGLSTTVLLERLQITLAYIQQALEKLHLQDLEAMRVSPRDGQQVTCGWGLEHILSHTAEHVGQMQITRQWWERR